MTRDNFDETLGGCLRDAGFETSYDGTGTLERLESVDEREATYDYYARFLEALERDCPSAPPWQRDGASG